MYLSFVKIHLIIFEVVSTLLFLSIFFALFYYSIIYKSYPAMQEEGEKNVDILNISFSANYSKGTFSDIDLQLFPRDEIPFYAKDKYLNATILYSKPAYKEKQPKEIIKEISDVNPYNIFLFEDTKIAENFKHRIKSLTTMVSTFNLTLFTLISLFLIFLKITLSKDTYYRLKKIKSSKSDGKNEIYTNLLNQMHPKEYALNSIKDEKKNLYYNPVLSFLNPINCYYYIFFHLTIVVIIPLIFPDFVEFYISSYFGFMSNMYYSVYYGRSLFGNGLLNPDNFGNINITKLITPRNITSQRNLFIVHDFLNLNDYVPNNTNPYVINLLIMTGSIWLAQIFHPFDTQGTVKIVEVDLKKSKLKKFMSIFAIIAVFVVWGYFFIRGLIYQFDMYYLFHRLLFNNFKRILDIKVILYIILFYYHIVFYVIMGIYTYQTYSKNKKYKGNQRIVYTWFS